MSETTERTYPHGVTSWVDVATPDVDDALRFYGGLFGWTFTDAMPPGAPSRYVIAQLDGRDVAAVATAAPGEEPAWRTYVAVDDCDATTERLVGLGATLVEAPADAGPGGRTAALRDPEGVPFHLWQARARLGAQVVNAPGAWNFSNLKARHPATAGAWYAEAFGWRVADQGWSTTIQVPGYGDHLEGTVDPDIRIRQADTPDGFEDVVGAVLDAGDDAPHWHVVIAIADRDASLADVERLGGVVHDTHETDWARAALVSDPQGARLTLSQYAPR